MADTVLLDIFRIKLAAHMAGKNTLKPLKYMALGDGGHDKETHEGLSIDPTQKQLGHEIFRRELSKLENRTDFSVTGSLSVEKNELVDQDISERALCDADGDAVAMHTGKPLHKQDDEVFTTFGTIQL